MKISPYTAIWGKRDPIRKDILCFTEKDGGKFVTPCMNAKQFKVLSHLYVDADVSIWMDGYVKPKVPVETLAAMLGDADMVVFRHPHGLGSLEHAVKIKKVRPHQVENIDEQIKEYLARGLPPDDPVLWG